MPNPPAIGSLAPDFCLPSPAGTQVCLSNLRGQWVVVYFYPRDASTGCTAEAMEFNERLREFHGLDCVVLGISRDSLASHERFIDKCKLMVPLLSDEGLSAIEAYGAWRAKKIYGKEIMGVERSTYLVDPQGVVRAAWPSVRRASGHAAEVLEKLREVVVGLAEVGKCK
ncbi:Peroxiredoxin [Desulfocurvibacter africanus PCS]|uniref:thioredoxin-dependent peroxiredoxin n=1 Tax=Desulfocurvibacter africanus PCS TaxID=1262666 RepID=M5Q259_DESAF|nr:peroxiredoxin [Desulfocurvibacter africanus]EMG38166.1 Peroxiredoxin [Desulfocurvibacter africanus PCS]